jgi:hypothetical protein
MVPRLGSTAYSRPNKPTIGFNSLIGLLVQADEGRATELGAAVIGLANALKLEGLAAKSEVGQMPASMNKGVIYIQIGKKPQ